jgi:hypothetical protein
MDDDRVSHNRAITFNDTYNKLFMEYIKLSAVCLAFLLLAYVSYRAHFFSGVWLITILATTVLLMMFSNIQKRDNIYYDEINVDASNMIFPSLMNRIVGGGSGSGSGRGSGKQTEKEVPEPVSYCVGSQCCSTGTAWSAQDKKCIQGFTTIEDAYKNNEMEDSRETKNKCRGIYK